MNEDIERLFSTLSESVPTSDSGNEMFAFFSSNLPLPPREIDTDSLYIKKMQHGYDGYFLAEQLWIFAQKPTYRYLALLTLAVLFHRKVNLVHLRLTHPWSDIKHLIIRFLHPSLLTEQSGYFTRPYRFNYCPRVVGYHPWLYDRVDPYDLPCFFLTSVTESVINDGWALRDTVMGFGSDQGTVRFAELLLNISRPQNTDTEYVLEGEGGYRSVGVQSAEARLYLPGSLAWDEAAWE